MGSPSAPIGAAPNAHIYCHFCGSIQPLVIDEPQRGEDSRFDCATDLVCAACQFVMDYLKTDAPFWKKERTDTGVRWVEARDSDAEARERWK